MPRDGNFYSDYGTYTHQLLERYAKDSIPAFALASVYEEGFDKAIEHDPPPFPKTLRERYFEAGKAYFENFDGFDKDWEVDVINGKPAVELRFEMEIGGYPFVGVIDLVLRNKKTGARAVIDHKSKSKSSMRKELPLYTRQLYIYAAYIKEETGSFPDTLCFNMFKEGYDIRIPFSKEQFDETMAWVTDTIEEIILESEWKTNPNPYFCRFICPVLDYCPDCIEIKYID